jgi:hypothetical protein
MMSQSDEHTENTNSLLRRLLNKRQEPRIPHEDLPERKVEALPPDAVISPIPSRPASSPPSPDTPVSPIRPKILDNTEPQPPLTPTLPERGAPEEPLTPREQMQRAEEALINLRQKMANVASEFAQGKLNQAQFDAIYSRYSEQRMITEGLLARDPETQAWQSVVRPGHTQFLKSHYEAHVVSYAIHDQDSYVLIAVTGSVQIQHSQVEAVLARLKAVSAERGNPGPAQKKLRDGQSVLFVPGDLTAAVVIFSVEPSTVQIERVADIHHDFERANQHALRRKDYAAGRLVFPHRALFEEKKY